MYEPVPPRGPGTPTILLFCHVVLVSSTSSSLPKPTWPETKKILGVQYKKRPVSQYEILVLGFGIYNFFFYVVQVKLSCRCSKAKILQITHKVQIAKSTNMPKP